MRAFSGSMLGTETVGAGKKIGVEIILQGATTTPKNGEVIYMDKADTFKVTEISGTSTSRTLIFEVSGTENGTYSAIQGVRLSDISLATQTTEIGGIWQFEGLAGLWFRVRVSAIAGGNVTVKGKAVG